MTIHTLIFNPQNWMELSQQLSQLDRFDAQWQAIERREKSILKELKSIATVRSVGASTRIEGSRLSDKEVEVLLENLDIKKLAERDQQEVVGYFEALNLICESYSDIPITESSIKHLHNVLMKYNVKDAYHRGNYKINSNRVEQTNADGSKITIFETTTPGWATEDAMAKLVNWYNNDTTTQALIKAALFVYDFLSIHPFQDGNGRLSRLIATLLIMRSGYVWIEYVSFEHEIEHRKKDYYKYLMQAQRNRPGEDVTEWVNFFLDCLKNIQDQLMKKLKEKERRETVGLREQYIYTIVQNNPGISSGEIATKLNIPASTVKRILSELVAMRNLVVHGAGRGTRYSSAGADTIKYDIPILLSNTKRVKEFTLTQPGSFIWIKKIILTPKFSWKHPNEWSTKLLENNLYFTVHATTSKGVKYSQLFSVFAYNDPTYFQPVFIVHPNIVIPDLFNTYMELKWAFPIQGSIELSGDAETFDFDLMLVSDQY